MVCPQIRTAVLKGLTLSLPTKMPRSYSDYCSSHVEQIYRDLDPPGHLDPNQPLGIYVQDLYHTDPPQETCATSRRVYGSNPGT